MPLMSGLDLKQAYRQASVQQYALIANNFAETDILLGLVAAYSEAKSDLLLQVSHGAASFAGGGDALAGLRALVGYARAVTERHKIGVFVNLDHVTPARVDSFLRPAVDEGLCSSVMIDASAEPFEENVAQTRAVVEYARGRGVLVEAELGKIKGVEDEISSDEAFYTDPDEAVEFVARTGADLLAVSVGTQHGVSKGCELSLRPDLAASISESVRRANLDCPLVLHGASGLSADQVRRLVEAGVVKVNKDTTYQYVHARTSCAFYLEGKEAVLPPEGTEFDPITFESGDSPWHPNKKVFDPRIVGREVQRAIAEVARAMIDQVRSGGRTIYG